MYGSTSLRAAGIVQSIVLLSQACLGNLKRVLVAIALLSELILVMQQQTEAPGRSHGILIIEDANFAWTGWAAAGCLLAQNIVMYIVVLQSQGSRRLRHKYHREQAEELAVVQSEAWAQAKSSLRVPS